jgi:hypothetical protein
MPNLELSTNELLMLKDLLENDMEQTSQAGNAYHDDYGDVNLMQYYLDRATVLKKVREDLGLTIVHEEEEV